MGDVNKLFAFKILLFVDNAQQCFAFTPQANFPAHNLNFHWRWRWWDQIQATFQNLSYFKEVAIFCHVSKVSSWRTAPLGPVCLEAQTTIYHESYACTTSLIWWMKILRWMKIMSFGEKTNCSKDMSQII